MELSMLVKKWCNVCSAQHTGVQWCTTWCSKTEHYGSVALHNVSGMKHSEVGSPVAVKTWRSVNQNEELMMQRRTSDDPETAQYIIIFIIIIIIIVIIG